MEQVYFWLSVMLKLKLAANFNKTTTKLLCSSLYLLCNILFIDFVFFGEWMNKRIFIYFTSICINMKYVIIQMSFFSFFFFFLIVNELSLTKESSII
jgi:hypothetical protein